MPTSEVYNIDCRVGLPTLPYKWAYLAVCDTQYGIKEDGRKSASRAGMVLQKNGTRTYVGSNHRAAGWDNETMDSEYWNMVREKSRHQAIFGINYIVDNIPYVTMDWGKKPPRREQYAEFIERNPIGFIIWDKCNGASDFADCELIWVSLEILSFVKCYMWSGMMQAKNLLTPYLQQGNKKLNQKRIHPTEKPIMFLQWLCLKLGCTPGCNICDTHSGSQSLRIAADRIECNYLGYETDYIYFSDGDNRYSSTKQSLFNQ